GWRGAGPPRRVAGAQHRRGPCRLERGRPSRRQAGALAAGPAGRRRRVGGGARLGMKVGVDTGGTFTDVVDETCAVTKVLSAPDGPDGAEAVAVCLLHADLDPAHEHAVASELRGRGHDVTASSDVSPEFREYERTVTTVVNAYLRPVCGPYVGRMADLADDVL